MQGGQDEENWEPLQSNPEVINTFIAKMGLKTQLFSFQELLSTEDWGLQMVPKPVLGILLLFEQTPAQKAFKQTEGTSLKPEEVPKNIFFMKQKAINACGTIGLFHIILNAKEKYPQIVTPASFLDKFSASSKGQDPEKAAELFKNSKEIMTEHKQAVSEGVTSVDSKCNAHFISFIEKNGHLWELDGFKKCPVDHGACTHQEFLTKGSAEIRKFMDRDPDNINFSMIVLCSSSAQVQ